MSRFFLLLSGEKPRDLSLQQALAGYDASLTDYNSAELLYHAFEGGELTLLQYLMESDYFFEAYDLHLVTAELTAWQL